MELTFDIRDWWAKTQEIILRPGKFFVRAKKEKGIKASLSFFLTLSLVGAAIQLVASFLPVFAPPAGLNTILFVVFPYIIGIVSSFAMAFFLHLWLKVFGSKDSFDKAYQLFVYSSTPGLLLRGIPIAGLAAGFYGLYLLILGTEVFYGLGRKRTLLAYVILFLFVAIILTNSKFPFLSRIFS